MSSSSLLGRCTISAVHKLTEPIGDVTFYRAQGVALPSGIIINHFAYGLLEKRSKNLVGLIYCIILALSDILITFQF